MRVKFVGESEPFGLTNGKEYEVDCIDKETGLYAIYDEEGELSLWFPECFEIISGNINDVEVR